MPILVTSTPRPAAAASLRRKGALRSNGSRFTLGGDGEAAPEAPAPAAVLCPSVLLQLQEAPPPGPAHSRQAALRHGADLLDRLEELRLALLSGAVEPAGLRAIADALATRSGQPDDPRLGAIIAEIELRCAVELAKFDRANRPAPSQAPDLGADFRSSSKV